MTRKRHIATNLCVFGIVVVVGSGLLFLHQARKGPKPVPPDAKYSTEVEVDAGRVALENLEGDRLVLAAGENGRISGTGSLTKVETPQPAELAARPEPTPQPEVEPAAFGQVEGKVVDTRGKPVANCEAIFLFKDDSTLAEFIARGRYRLDEPHAVTDPNGKFLAKNLLPGSYSLAFQAPGYAFAAYPGAVKVVPGETVTGITQTLGPAGTIFGYVIENLSGEPIKGVTISASISSRDYPRNYNWATSLSWHQKIAAFSRDDGSFQHDTLFPYEAYDLTAEHPSYAPVREESVRVDTGEAVRFVLSPGGTIEGRVVSEVEGVQVEGSEVVAWTNHVQEKIAKCSAAGSFRMVGLPPGEYGLTAHQGSRYSTRQTERIRIRHGSRVSGVVLILRPGPKVSGRVIDKDSREGIPNVRLSYRGLGAKSDEEGRFVLENLPSDREPLMIKQVPKPYVLPEHHEQTYLVVQDHDIPDLIIELEGGATVRGRVLGRSGQAAEGILVHILGPEIGRRYDAPTWSTSEGDGSFEISGLRAGEGYRLEATYARSSPGMSSSPYGTGDDRVAEESMGTVLSEPFSLAPKEIKEGIVLRLKAFGRISGTVKDDRGRPIVEGYRVILEQLLPNESRFLFAAKWGEGGFFYTDHPPSGKIVVTLCKEIPGNNTTYPARIDSKTVTVEPNRETAGVDFVVPGEQREGYIAGRVVDDRGEGIPDSLVHLFRYNASDQAYEPFCCGYGPTDAAGQFRIEDLEDGLCKLWVPWSRQGPGSLAEDVECPSEAVMLVMERFGKIEGRVVRKGTGEPVQRFRAGVITGAPIIGTPRARKWPDILYTFDDPSGRFLLDQVHPGNTLLRVVVEDLGEFRRPMGVHSGEEIADVLIEVGETTGVGEP